MSLAPVTFLTLWFGQFFPNSLGFNFTLSTVTEGKDPPGSSQMGLAEDKDTWREEVFSHTARLALGGPEPQGRQEAWFRKDPEEVAQASGLVGHPATV